jgi:hypothetical protein
LPLSRWVAASCVAVVCAGALGGCAVKPGASDTPSGLVVSPVATSGTPSASVSLPPTSALPSGAMWVTTAGHGAKFAVPGTWAMFDLTTFGDPAVKAALEPIAERLGKSVDDYIRELTTNNDLIVTGPDAGGYSPSISVRKEEGQTVGDPPSTTQAQTDVAALSGTVTAVTPVTTALGVGYAVAYTRPGDAAGVTLYCATVDLPTPRGTAFMMTVESNTAADRDALVATAVATLQKA